MFLSLVSRKRKWSEVEIAAVEEKIMKFIHSGVTPGKVDCIACITAAPKTLGERDWQTVKYYIKKTESQHMRERPLKSKVDFGCLFCFCVLVKLYYLFFFCLNTIVGNIIM